MATVTDSNERAEINSSQAYIDNAKKSGIKEVDKENFLAKLQRALKESGSKDFHDAIQGMIGQVLGIVTSDTSKVNESNTDRSASSAADLLKAEGWNGRPLSTASVTPANITNISAQIAKNMIGTTKASSGNAGVSPIITVTHDQIFGGDSRPASVGHATALTAPIARSTTDMEREYTSITGKSPLVQNGSSTSSVRTLSPEFQAFLKQKNNDLASSVNAYDAAKTQIEAGWGKQSDGTNGPTKSTIGRPSNMQPGDYWTDPEGNLREFGGTKVQTGIQTGITNGDGSVAEPMHLYNPLGINADGRTGSWAGTGRTRAADQGAVNTVLEPTQQGSTAGAENGSLVAKGVLEMIAAMGPDQRNSKDALATLNAVNKDLMGDKGRILTMSDLNKAAHLDTSLSTSQLANSVKTDSNGIFAQSRMSNDGDSIVAHASKVTPRDLMAEHNTTAQAVDVITPEMKAAEVELGGPTTGDKATMATNVYLKSGGKTVLDPMKTDAEFKKDVESFISSSPNVTQTQLAYVPTASNAPITMPGTNKIISFSNTQPEPTAYNGPDGGIAVDTNVALPNSVNSAAQSGVGNLTNQQVADSVGGAMAGMFSGGSF